MLRDLIDEVKGAWPWAMAVICLLVAVEVHRHRAAVLQAQVESCAPSKKETKHD